MQQLMLIFITSCHEDIDSKYIFSFQPLIEIKVKVQMKFKKKPQNNDELHFLLTRRVFYLFT